MSYVRGTFKPVTPDLDHYITDIYSGPTAVIITARDVGIQVENPGIVTFYFFFNHTIFFPLSDLYMTLHKLFSLSFTSPLLLLSIYHL